MAALFVSEQIVYCVVERETGPEVAGKEPFTSDFISVCAGGAKVLYYIPSDAPLTIRCWRLSHTSDAAQSTEVGHACGPEPLSKILFHNNKVYAIASTTDCLYVYDPLNKSVETIHVGVPLLDFEAASHGFVFKDTAGHFYGYHFTDGLTPVTGLDGAELLGQYKRFAVALRPNTHVSVAVTESGTVVTSGVPTVRRPFVTVDEKLIEADPSGLFYNHRRIPLPSGMTNFGSLMRIPQMDDESVCTLCFCEFDDEVGVTFDCGHQFHLDCINQWARRWDEFKEKGNHIVFTNAVCPGGCKHLMRHPSVTQTASIGALYKETTAKAKTVARSLGGTKTEDDVLFYICSCCGHPFYGGERVCFRMQGQEPAKAPRDLICDDCRDDFHCDRHDRQFVVYKCQYCCNPATQRSFGTRYLCERCNGLWEGSTEPDVIACPGPAQCPLGGCHNEEATPPVVIGCQACLPSDALVYERIVQPPCCAAGPEAASS